MTPDTLVGEGREAEVFLLDDGTVLKLLRDPGTAGRVHREAIALEAIATTGIAAPRPISETTRYGLEARIGRAPLEPDVRALGSTDQPTLIDWGNAARGTPAADVARSDLLLRFGVPPLSAVQRLVARPAATGMARAAIGEYRRHRALPSNDLRDWRIVRAAARLDEPVTEERDRLRSFVVDELARWPEAVPR